MLDLCRLHYDRIYFSFILVKFQVIKRHVWIFICRNKTICVHTGSNPGQTLLHPHSIPAPSLFYPHSIQSQCRIHAGSMLALHRLHYGRNYFSFILVKFQVIEKHIWIFICRNTRFCIWTFICRNTSFYVHAGSIPAPSLLHPHSI